MVQKNILFDSLSVPLFSYHQPELQEPIGRDLDFQTHEGSFLHNSARHTSHPQGSALWLVQPDGTVPLSSLHLLKTKRWL